MFTASVSIAALVLVNNIITSRLTAPLNELVRFMDNNAGGDFTSRVRIETGDEYEVLAIYFNRFIDTYQQQIRKIDEANRSIKILAKFPDESENPVIRISTENIIEYANSSAEENILGPAGIKTGERIPEAMMTALTEHHTLYARNEYSAGDRVYSFQKMEISDREGLYLAGQDITRQKKI